MSRQRWLATTGVIALALTTTVACSSGGADPAPSDEPAGCGTGESVVVNLPNFTPPTTLDANYDTIIYFTQVYRNLFDGLFKLNDDMEVVPDLAASFDQPDDLTYDIALRDDVTFHDGSPFTSADVVSTFDRITNDTELASKQKSYVANVASVEAVDEHNVKITLKQPDASFIRVLATLIYITPASVISEVGDADFGTNPVGTGPFKFESWNGSDSVVLSANCDYHDGETIPSTVEFRFITEPATAVSSLQSGELDIAMALPPDLAATLEGSSDLKVQEEEGNRTFFLSPNTLEGPFADQKVRQALNYAIDRESLTTQLLGGHATPRGQVNASSVFGFSEDVKPYPYDPEKAEELLADAGYKPGEVQIELVLDQDIYRPQWQAIAASLADSGFEVTTTFDPNFFADTFLAKKMGPNQIYFNSTANVLMDADFPMGLHLDGARRGLYFHTPETDKAIAEARAIADPDERQKAYDKLNAELFDVAPVGFLWTDELLYGTSTRIDWTPRPDQAIYLAGVTKTP